VVAVFAALIAWRVIEALGRREVAAATSVPTGPTPVQVATVERRDISGVIELSGTLRPANEVDVAPDVSGRVVSVSVSVGTRVDKGEELARLDATDLELALAQAEGALAAAVAGRDAAVQEAATAEKLAASSSITENQLVGARSRKMAADGQLKQSQASRDLAKERVNDAKIASPIAGIVTRADLDVGRMVTPGAAVFQIQDDSAYEVDVGLDEATAYTVHPGQPVEVQSLARPDRIVPGTIATVAPTLDPQTRKALAVVRLDPTTEPLLGYSTVTVRIAQQSRAGVVTVPASAVFERGADTIVRLVVEGNTVKIVAVRTGARLGELVEVFGIQPGAQVVVAGPADLVDGTVVEPRS
ncbi:MAG: efflux RND transporter periplasmic adaptor subunit, partial [Myxococcota bacterium]